MSYINIVVDDTSEHSKPPLEKVGRFFRKLLSRIKWALKERGWRVRFKFTDAQVDGRHKPPTIGWELRSDEPPSPEQIQEFITQEIIPWLDEKILRSPVPMGIDSQCILIGIYEDNGVKARHRRVVDKYGWRKEGREETSLWLGEKLGELSILDGKLLASVVSLGRLITAYDLIKPYELPSLEDIG